MPDLAGDEYTIAHIISYPWTVNWKGQGQDLAQSKYFKRWFDELSARPGVQRGLAVDANLERDATPLTPEEVERRNKCLQPACHSGAARGAVRRGARGRGLIVSISGSPSVTSGP